VPVVLSLCSLIFGGHEVIKLEIADEVPECTAEPPFRIIHYLSLASIIRLVGAGVHIFVETSQQLLSVRLALRLRLLVLQALR
jgi:hypothetical protein